jgi:hypothetical protein
MRALDFLKENSDGDVSGAAPGVSAGKRKGLRPDHSNAISGAQRYPDTPSHYYDMYRFGVHMAGSPGRQTMDPNGPAANEMVTLAYSQADLEIVNNSAKEMGLRGAEITKFGSTESKDIHAVSPVNNWNKRK